MPVKLKKLLPGSFITLMMTIGKTVLFITLLVWTGNILQGQLTVGNITGTGLSIFEITVPFLTIAPDARAGAMGDVGAASSADVNSQHWNSAKYAFIEGKGGVAITYTPWGRNLIPGMNLTYLSGYYKIDDKNRVSSAFRYFTLPEITFFTTGGTVVSQYRPKEFAVDAGYSRLFTDNFSGGIVLRYIHSDLTDGQTTADGQETKAGTSFAGDLGLYYQDDIQVGEKYALWAVGLNISNVGTPISYTEDAEKTPIPTNLRIGGRFEYSINEQHSISLNADVNKLLVPTPPVYETDTVTGKMIVLFGKEAPESVLAGMFQSFYDAPGTLKSDGTRSVFREEMHEITCSIGLEYRYRNQFAIRSGYFHEHSTKGNRKYFTVGMGVIFKFISLDASYLRSGYPHSPLANTFRLTLKTEFGRVSNLELR